MLDDSDKFYRVIKSKDFFDYVTVPDDWDTLEAFVDWYLGLKMPMMIPWDAEIICSDDATAVCMFRHGRYQAELYLVHPQQYVPHHSHPDMEVMTLFLAGGQTSPKGRASAHNMGRAWGQLGHKVMDGAFHGGSKRPIDKNGFGLIAFQKWPEGVTPRSAAMQWKGETAGPKQEAMIRKEHPDAYVTTGYADISQHK